MTGRPRKYDYAKVAEMAATMSRSQIAAELGCASYTVDMILRKIGVSPVRLRKPPSERRTSSRHEMDSHEGKSATMPPFDHPSIVGGRTIFPSSVKGESDVRRALKSGHNAMKIGAVVRKGRWKGMPIFTLTLEERATCPVSCRHWRSCYGNNMHWAERLRPGRDLEWRLDCELGILNLDYRNGFVVRLHVLGDFYSVEYVWFWRRMLEKYPSLRVFGYSARWDIRRDPIAAALVDLTTENWSRFAIRMSNAPMDGCATVSVETPMQAPAGAIVCPAQTGKTESCSTCALCWSTMKNIAFLQH